MAVLVNGLMLPGADGQPVYQERSADELEALHELVASAVGFQEARGDVVTIKSMELPASAPLGTAAVPSLFSSLDIDLMSLIQLAVLAVVALVLALFVIRPILARPAAAAAPAALPALPDLGLPDLPVMGGPALTGEIDDDDFHALPQFGLPSGDEAMGGGNANPVDRLRALIGERQDETVEILRSWLEESTEKAT